MQTTALIIDVPNASLLPKVCYEIGNRHAPFFRGQNDLQFYTPVEQPIKVMLEKLGVTVTIGDALLVDAISQRAGHSHGHGHGH